MLVMAEDTACGHHLQDFHGFTMARNLRVKERFLGPIILVSCLPKEFFLERMDQRHEFRILQGRGTGFLDLHDINDEEKVKKVVEGIRPLSAATLLDLNTSLLSLYGYIRSRVGHDLRPGMAVVDRKALLDEVRQSLPGNEAAMLFTEEVLAVLLADPVNEPLFRSTAIDLAERIAQLDPEANGSTIRSIKPKVLVLEDQQEERERMREGLEKDGTFEVVAVQSAADAMKLIEADEANEFLAMVSDWRLFMNPNAQANKREWQSMQGYEVLAHAAENRHIALFALTSLLDNHVHAIRNVLGLDIWLQRKEHLNSEGAWASFRDVVYDACERKLDIIAGQPTGARWSIYKGMPEPAEGEKKKGGRPPKDGSKPGSKGSKNPVRSFKDRYREQRNRVDWASWEAGISKRADEIWDKWCKPMLEKSWADIPKKSYKDITGVQLVTTELGLDEMLVYRRIYLALWCTRYVGERLPAGRYPVKNEQDGVTHEHPSWDITCILSGQSPEERGIRAAREGAEEWRKQLLKDAKDYAHWACIKRDDLGNKFGLLPEERAWLSRNGFELPEAEVEEDEGDGTVTKPAPAKKPKAERSKPNKSAASKPKKAHKADKGPSDEDLRKADDLARRWGLG